MQRDTSSQQQMQPACSPLCTVATQQCTDDTFIGVRRVCHTWSCSCQLLVSGATKHSAACPGPAAASCWELPTTKQSTAADLHGQSVQQQCYQAAHQVNSRPAPPPTFILLISVAVMVSSTLLGDSGSSSPSNGCCCCCSTICCSSSASSQLTRSTSSS